MMSSRLTQLWGCRAYTRVTSPYSTQAPQVDISWYFTPDSKNLYNMDARIKSEFGGGSVMDWVRFCYSGRVQDTFALANCMIEKTPVTLHDARALEASEGLTKAAFFHKHSFVILTHKSDMSAQGWLDSSQGGLAKAKDSITAEEFAQSSNHDHTPVKALHGAEIKQLLAQLLPSATEWFVPSRGVRRGPGDKFYGAVYGSQAHTDFPIVYQEFKSCNEWMGLEEQLKQYESNDEHRAHMTINLWRPVLPMQHALKDRPLALLAPSTVDRDDLVGFDVLGQVPGGQRYMTIKQNPKHKWYYYPDMRTDEVLVWKQSHFQKPQDEQFSTDQAQGESSMAVPHTAVEVPGTPEDSEVRCSFEMRVAALCSTPDGK